MRRERVSEIERVDEERERERVDEERERDSG